MADEKEINKDTSIEVHNISLSYRNYLSKNSPLKHDNILYIATSDIIHDENVSDSPNKETILNNENRDSTVRKDITLEYTKHHYGISRRDKKRERERHIQSLIERQ